MRYKKAAHAAEQQKKKTGKGAVTAPFSKDDVLTIRIDDIGRDGEGIGRAPGGYTLFVKDAVIGDTARVMIMKAGKSYGYAKLLSVEEPSPFRTQPRCPIARQCGGCQIQALSYERQLAFKTGKVRGDLIRIGGFSEEFVDGILRPAAGMEDPWRYRGKAQVPVGMRKDAYVYGFFAGRTHDIIQMGDCLISPPENKAILDAVIAYMEAAGVRPYDETTGEGLIRHVLIRTGFRTGEIMVCVIANAEELPEEEELVSRLLAVSGKLQPGSDGLRRGIASIVLNTNRERTNVILGRKCRTLCGSPVIRDTLLRPDGSAVTFEISPLSFFQVNPIQTEKLYGQVLSFAGLTGTESVWDLYCGVGTISLFLAAGAGKVFGVEVIPEAIEDAKRNAAINGLTNVTFETGRAEDVLPARAAQLRREAAEAAGRDAASAQETTEMTGTAQITDAVDVVVVDPPRKGLDRTCIDTILQVGPKKVVYVSCDPATLARDLKIFAEGGYELRAAQPVDMFPHTVHVETVCCLYHQKKDFISVSYAPKNADYLEQHKNQLIK